MKMNNDNEYVEKLTISDDINDVKAKERIENYSNEVEDKIKSYLITYLLNLKVSDYQSLHEEIPTEIPINIDEEDICSDDIDEMFRGLYPIVFEVLLYKMVKEKLIENIKKYKIKIKIDEILRKRFISHDKVYDIGYIQKREQKEISQKVTMASARKLMSMNHIPKFEYHIWINTSYYVKTEHNTNNIITAFSNIVYDILSYSEHGTEQCEREISYKKFVTYCMGKNL